MRYRQGEHFKYSSKGTKKHYIKIMFTKIGIDCANIVDANLKTICQIKPELECPTMLNCVYFVASSNVVSSNLTYLYLGAWWKALLTDYINFFKESQTN